MKLKFILAFGVLVLLALGLIGVRKFAPGVGAESFVATSSTQSSYSAVDVEARRFFYSSGTSTAVTQGRWAYFISSGVDYAYYQMSFTATSVLPCRIKSGFLNSTSTILYFDAQVTTGLSGSNGFTLATSTDGYATSSSSLGFRTVGSTLLDLFHWEPWMLNVSTTTGARVGLLNAIDNNGGATNILGPTEWLVWKNATTTPGSGSWSGTCSVLLMKP